MIGGYIGAPIGGLVNPGHFTDTVGVTAGIATVTGVGASYFSVVGASVGITTVSGVGASYAGTVGSSAGAAIVAGVGNTAIDTVFIVNGVAVVLGTIDILHDAMGSSAGAAIVTGFAGPGIPEDLTTRASMTVTQDDGYRYTWKGMCANSRTPYQP